MNAIIRMDVLEKRMENHEKSKTPHSACPAHDATLQAILAALAEMKADIKTVADHVFILTREVSGRRKEQ